MKFRMLPVYAILFTLISCFQQPVYTSPAGYDLLHPEKFIRGEELLEISGIALRNGLADSIFAVNDEDGKLYAFSLNKKKNKSVRFGKGGDYEDVAILKDRVFILRSDGRIYNFSLDSIHKKKVEPIVWEDALPKAEYESLYADDATNKLYVLCKSCGKDSGIPGYVLTAAEEGRPDVEPFRIDHKFLREKFDFKGAFKASALARNVRTNQWYILSAVQKVLLIADANWNILEAHRLSPSLFSQPEGMAFDTSGNLYISNEGHEMSNGNVLRFNFKP